MGGKVGVRVWGRCRARPWSRGEDRRRRRPPTYSLAREFDVRAPPEIVRRQKSGPKGVCGAIAFANFACEKIETIRVIIVRPARTVPVLCCFYTDSFS